MTPMPGQPSKLPPVIATKLRAFERRRKTVSAARGLAGTLLVFCAGLIIVLLLETVFHPSLPWRISLSVLNYTATATFFLYSVCSPLLIRRRLDRIARAFESSAAGQFQERILSAVEMARSFPPADQPGVSAWMAERTIALAGEEISVVDPAHLVDPAPATQAGKRALAAVCVLGLTCILPGFIPRAWLALNPYADTSPLLHIEFAVQPGNCRIRNGSPLEIRASGRNLPDLVTTKIRWDDGFQESVPMARLGTNEFSLSLAAVSQGFRYSVQAGEAESVLFTVTVDLPPRIARIQLLIQPPAYTHWTNRVVEGGSEDFLLGSKVRVLLDTADEKVAEAEWDSDIPQTRTFRVENDRLVLDLAPSNPVSYQVHLTGANKLKSESSQRWSLRPLPDEPPMARLFAIAAGTGMVQGDELLPFQIHCTDDVGLKRVDLIVLNRDSQADVKPIYAGEPENASREIKMSLNYNLADLNALDGDEVQFQLVAVDVRDQTTRSDPISFTIGSADKALEAQLATRIKQLVSATAAQLDYLQQTRASWLSIGRNFREDDLAAQLPALTVFRSRLNEFGLEMGKIGDRLVSESETNNLNDARFMYRLGTTISAWGGQQRQVLLDNSARLQQAKGTNIYNAFNLGRELFSRALTDLEQYKRVLFIFESALETDVLATRCESAQGRYQRGLPILRGENVIAPLGAGTGLLATFFEGIELNGKTLEQKISDPGFDNYAPATRREDWSVRYEGDINIQKTADWTLACVSDDGVRLILDGKSVLPRESWSAHAATQYKADLKLEAGWHPLQIEFFQASSESKLQFLASKQGEPLQEVPVAWLRPPSAREPRPDLATNAALAAIVKDALKDRVRSSLSTPASVPPTLAPMTNDVHNKEFTRMVSEKLPVGDALSSNLLAFASWKTEDSTNAEAQSDDLVALAKNAQKILREELNRYRWRYEGAAALKKVQNAIEELREANQELHRQPWNPKNKRTEQAQSKIEFAKAWQQELQRSAAEAAHSFFDTARQKDATLAERAAALTAATKADRELRPAVEKLATALDSDGNKDEVAGRIDQRLNEINDRYRELNDLQEKINREQVAAEARKAFPPARAFERAQNASDQGRMAERYQKLQPRVAAVLKAERVAGDYSGAQRLESLAGDSPQNARGRETTRELRALASRTDRNFPSLAQSIPPPMREETDSLENYQSTPAESANELAQPRLAMSLESSRLLLQGDRRTAVAYELLGGDLGALLDSPDKLSAPTLKPLAERAAALAGEKGEQARQDEINAANERLKQMAKDTPENPDALAERLDSLSALAKEAAGDAPKREPLNTQLDEMGALAQPTTDWTEATDPREIAAGAAQESSSEIQSAPKRWESYNDASQILADAARQIRMDSTTADLADLNPYAVPAAPSDEMATITGPTLQERTGNLDGAAGQAITQPPPPGLDQAEWARLNERLRQAIRSSGIENFSEEQQAAIRAYFERLSSDSTKPSLAR